MNTLQTSAGLSACFSKRKTLLAAASALLVAAVSLPVMAGITIPATPLQSGAAVPPNIMFILDDSGSMASDVVPESIIFGNGTIAVGAFFLFPTPAGLFSGNLFNNVAEVDDVNTNADDNLGYPALVRSSSQNPIYYNPAVTYIPWTRPDGTQYPQASSTCAYHDPTLTGNNTVVGCRNLTADNTTQNNAQYYRCVETSTPGTCVVSAAGAARTFFPALYYRYNGGDRWMRSSYTKVEIRSTTATYSGDGRISRTDCGSPADGICSYNEEIQNFANWYSYYRARLLTAKAGIGQAFADLPQDTPNTPAPRIGFGSINTNGVSVDGVTSNKTIINGVRPFNAANRLTFFNTLYSKVLLTGGTPLRRALQGAGEYYERPDNTGPWSETPGTASGTPQLSCRQSYSILTTDGYWNGAAANGNAGGENDGSSSPAAITSPGGASYTYTAVNPFTDGNAGTLADVAMYYWKTDLRTDLVNRVPVSAANPAFWQHMTTIGVSIGLSGAITPATAFAAIPTGTAVAWPDPTSGDEPKIDDLLHAAVNSRGSFFTANNPQALRDGLTQTLSSINDRASSASSVATNSTSLDAGTRVFQATYSPQKWSGELRSFQVTSVGAAATPEWSASEEIPAPNSRNIFTRNASGGAAFTWANLTAAQRTSLGSANVLNYLRGDRSLEGAAPAAFRIRDSALGDIINSSPVLVRSITNPTTTPGVVYAGANDGMLHAFRVDNGEEIFAYVPSIINWDNLATLASKSYSHQHFVDGQIAISQQSQTPGERILVSGLGRGGKGIFALDVSNPLSFTSTDVKWEYAGDADMGLVVNAPTIAKLNNGDVVALVSNGLNSTNDDSVLFVINLDTGALIRKISTGNTTNNGLSGLRTLDSDKDGDIDFVFAGDYQGNIWKFDLTSNASATWSASKLFTALDASGNAQPISGGVTLGRDSSFNLWVFFGTGRYITTGDPADTNVQTWYGIQDGPSTIAGRSELKQRSILITTTLNGVPVRAFEKAVSGDLVGKKGWYIDLVEPPNPPGTALGERMIGTPLLRTDSVLLALSITPNADRCESGGTSFLNAIDPYTGGNVTSGFFDADGNGVFDDQITANGITYEIGSYGLDIGIASGFVINANQILVGGSAQSGLGVSPDASSTQAVDSAGNPRTGRVSWREILSN
jgi:type IV pilus assembly protein PilY1